MRSRPRVAFIAAGHVAESHYTALANTGAGELATFYEPNAELAAARSRQWGVPAAAAPEQILDDPTIDAVYVLTPLESHFPYAMAALQAGKHVLVEKPVAPTTGEILQLARAARAAGRICMPGHNTLYIHEVRRIKQALAAGHLGDPAALYLHETYFMPLAKAQRYHGPVQEVLIHLLYVLLYLAGRPRALSAFVSRVRSELPGETQVMVNLSFPSGLLAHLFLSWGAGDHSADPWTYHLKVLGTRGSASFNRRAVVSGLEEAGNTVSPIYQEGFDAVGDYLLRRCIGAGQAPLSTLEDAADAAALLESIRRAAELGEVQHPTYPTG